MPISRVKAGEGYFYFGMSLLIAVVVVYGFSHTVERKLFHPVVARPFLLYIHVAIFSGWVIYFILQSALIRKRNVRLHRRLGWFGAGLGAAIPGLGIATAITMARFRVSNFHVTHVESDLIAQFFDMIAFTIPFALAIHWRKKPEFHRRLILIASCALTSAAFGRFPTHFLPALFAYLGVDALILLGVARDVLLNRRVHPVYVYGFPSLVLGQTLVVYAGTHDWRYLSQITRTILFG